MSADKIHAFEKDRQGEGVAIKDSSVCSGVDWFLYVHLVHYHCLDYKQHQFWIASIFFDWVDYFV